MAEHVLVYDIELKRPGCVLLQAVLGGTVPGFTGLFPSEDWLVAMTPGLKPYRLTDEQLAQVVKFHQREKA